jgi:acyl-CoA synthetase (AMP-forming)/AMP-acid ligase II
MTVESPPDSIQTLNGLLAEKATTLGDTNFFYYQNEATSYEELNTKANSIANELLVRGVEPNDIVCIFMYNRPEYLYTIFALAKIGAVAAPIDTRFSGDTLAHVLSETDARILILDADTTAEYESVRNRVSNITTEFFVGEQGSNQGFNDFEQLLKGDETVTPGIDVKGTDDCSVIYVQRYQTKHPQGVILPHYSYIHTGWDTSQNILNLSREDCVFTTLPFYSCYPIQMGIVSAMIAEAEFAFEKQFQRDSFWEWIRAYDATLFLYLGRMLSVLYNQKKEPIDGDNPAEYAVGHGFGIETDEEMIANFERRFDTTVLEAYGITPNATLATSNRPGDRKLGSVGKPISSAEVKIVDENDWVVPSGETGEIVIRPTRSNTMFRGFYNNSELSAEICRNQWIHTNDIGYKDEDGYVYFVANKLNTIQLGRVAGRISSLEIESVIESHSEIKESTVLGVSNKSGDEAIKAVIVPEKDSNLSPIDISKHCERHLIYHKLPRYIEFREELPRTPSGKIQKDHLHETKITNGVWDRESGYNLSR